VFLRREILSRLAALATPSTLCIRRRAAALPRTLVQLSRASILHCQSSQFVAVATTAPLLVPVPALGPPRPSASVSVQMSTNSSHVARRTHWPVKSADRIEQGCSDQPKLQDHARRSALGVDVNSVCACPRSWKRLCTDWWPSASGIPSCSFSRSHILKPVWRSRFLILSVWR